MADPWEQDWSQPASSGMPWEQDWTKQSAPAASATIGEKALDAYKGLGTGAIKGTLALGGMVGDLTNLGAQGLEKASNAVSGALGVEPYKRPETPSVLNAIPTSESLTKQLTGALGDFHQPKTEYGKASESVGQFIPGAVAATATGGGSLIGNIARYAVLPGAATYTAERALPETKYKPYLVGAAGVGAGLVNPIRAVTPFPANTARQAAVQSLANEGVTSLTAGQKTGNAGLRYIEDAASSAPLAGQGASRIQGEGARQFTEAATSRAGAEGLATPETLAANQTRLVGGTTPSGQQVPGIVNELAAKSTLIPDNKFITDLVDTVKGYKNVPESAQRAKVQGYVDDIVSHVNNGQMPGEAYQAMRSRLSRESKAFAGSDPDLSTALGGMKSALDSAMARSVGPQLGKEWAQFRKEYGAQKVLEKAASRAGEATLEGNITPANLRNTISAENRGSYARGGGPFNELARAGAQVMTPLPNSGTAQRMNAFSFLNSALGGVPQALAGRAVMSKPVQDILANQLMTGKLPANPTAQQLLLIKALQKQSGITIRPNPPEETK